MYKAQGYMVIIYMINKGVNTSSDINRKTILSSSYIINTNKDLIKAGILEVKKLSGLKKGLYLTEKGKRVSDAISILFNEMGIKEEDFLYINRQEEEIKNEQKQ